MVYGLGLYGSGRLGLVYGVVEGLLSSLLLSEECLGFSVLRFSV